MTAVEPGLLEGATGCAPAGPDGDDLVGRYRRDGFVVVPDLIDRSTVEEARADLARLRAVRPPGTAILTGPLGSNPSLDLLATDAGLTALARMLLGAAEVRCFGCSYIVKTARTGPPALWHQDGHPWQEMGVPVAVTLWVALDEMDAANGALEVIRGSHTTPPRPLQPAPARAGAPGGSFADGGMFGGGTDPGPVDPADVQVLRMAAGGGSAHHPWLFHGSGPNRSGRDRRAVAIRYRPA